MRLLLLDQFSDPGGAQLSGDLLTYWRVLPVYFWVLALAVRA
ncbi:MAG: hypothetical protein ACLQU1_37575 [Bryobacteraceae bacterium]